MDCSYINTKHISKNGYWKYFLNAPDFETILHKDDNLTPEDKGILFCRFVFVINLELSSACNRKCSYCPLSITPREQEYMEGTKFHGIINQLKAINYHGIILLNLYNEPLLDENLEKKISYIRDKLPNTWIMFNSNGDFLTKSRWEDLKRSGLNQIIVTLHTPPDGAYSDDNRKESLKKFLNKLGYEKFYDTLTEEKGKNITVDIEFSPKERLMVLCNNWGKYGADRGGSMKKLSLSKRELPCVNPFRELTVSYTGAIKPCCNIYFNASDIFGNIEDNNIVDLYFSDALYNFRRGVFSFSEKSGGCAYCNFTDNAEFTTKSYRDNLLKI